MFSDSSEMSDNEKIVTYGKIYLYSLIVPGISVIGVIFSYINSKSRLNKLVKNGLAFEKAYNLTYPISKITKPNPSIITGSILFVIFTTLALTLNAQAGTDGELLLKKINHQKLKIVLKKLIEEFLHSTKH